MLAIDNLHWGDARLFDLLDHMAHALARLRFALVTRYAHRQRRPAAQRAVVRAVDRAPTAVPRRDRRAGPQPAGRTDLSERLLDQLYERSGGNPLFLQELAGLSGMVEGELPDSLRTLIGARLDQLSPTQRQVIENAALMLGSAGSISHLEKFANVLNQPFNRSTLRELDELGLLEVRGDRWEFRSDSVREAADQMLTKASRSAPCRRRGGMSESYADTQPTPAIADSIAHHLASAAEIERELGHVPGVPWDGPRRGDRGAGRRRRPGARRRGPAHRGQRHHPRPGPARRTGRTTARRLGRPGARPRPAAHPAPAGALVDQRNYDEARADLDSVMADAIAAGDRATEGEARRLLGTMLHANGRLDQARAESA